ncbi:hypothetical protein AQJ84_16805 [Streptomyces resistomycificus]|uniref:Membrane protein n=2 Tax=Streptomyces resistomycificus TaxID=67356 RepID=A0A0L8L6D0_9ACTN|nr:membrane protein [Streptomyces resistomycificus]KUN97849.1 hypothetical protein AQJ84_16805 [Streptomyces resistomycificus]
MGRRTAWWRAGAWCGRGTAVRVVAVAALLGTTAGLAGAPARAADAPGAYAFDEYARSVTGATSTADAEPLEPGTTYRSSLPTTGRLHYRLELDVTSNAYVSVTAVPPPGATVSAGDGVKVSLQDADSHSCSVDTAGIGVGRSAHPVTALVERNASRSGTVCKGAGTYYVLVERVRRGVTSSVDEWDMEIAPVSEPKLEQVGDTSAPEDWDSASPTPPTGEPESREGGAGFDTATSLGQGVWRDDIRPGQTLFYEVPLDWGLQLYATAELGSVSGDAGFVPSALNLSLYNPVRGQVDDDGVGYDGSQRSAALRPLPPVAYANRYAAPDHVSGMRFAGSYYLVVHLVTQMAEDFGDGPFDLTLRVRTANTVEAGPAYAGQSEPRGIFQVTAAQDRESAQAGGASTDASAGGDALMRVLAVGGIGGGTVVLVVLGVWTGLGRRRGRPGARAAL